MMLDMNEQIEKELKKLEQQVLSIKPTNGIFKTFSLETSMGKTTTATNGIIKYLNSSFGNKKNRFVVVTKFANEGIEISKKIFEGVHGKYTILAYNHSNNLMEELDPEGSFTTNKLKGLKSAAVVIITHSTYTNICKAKYIKDETNTHYILRKILSSYKTLIIDEEINLVKETFASVDNLKLERLYKLFENLEDNYCRDLFIGIKDSLNKIINIHKELGESGCISAKYMCRVSEKNINTAMGNSTFNDNDNDKLINTIINHIARVDNLAIKRVENNKKIKLGSKNDIIDELEEIKLCIKSLENESVIYMPSANSSAGTINFYDEDIEYFKFKNNIYMDASACFNKIYELSREFEILETERLIDHSECKIIANIINTSSSSKRDIKATKEFNKKILTEIQKINKDTLIINSKDECSFMNSLEKEVGIEESKIEYTNFQNMRGRNNWRDYKYCYITHTPNLPFCMYVFMYEFYSNKRATNEEMIARNGKFNNYEFINSDNITRVYYSDLASSFYQGLKRICRSRLPIGEFHLYTHVGSAMVLLRKQLLNVQWEIVKELKFKKDSRASKIKIWIDTVWDGQPIRTKDILKNLNITQRQFDKTKEKNQGLTLCLFLPSMAEAIGCNLVMFIFRYNCFRKMKAQDQKVMPFKMHHALNHSLTSFPQY